MGLPTFRGLAAEKTLFGSTSESFFTEQTQFTNNDWKMSNASIAGAEGIFIIRCDMAEKSIQIISLIKHN